jgi:hypothetical protein
VRWEHIASERRAREPRRNMNSTKPWRQKLDPHGRLQVEDGLPPAGVNVTVRLTREDQTAAQQLEQSGLKLHSQVDDIVVGHVASATDLQHIAELPCVEEVQLASPLYEDRSDSSSKES